MIPTTETRFYGATRNRDCIIGNTFKTIGFPSVENPRDWRHRPEMALAVPALARAILDALYNSIFLFEDLSARSDWYMRAGWRELSELMNALNTIRRRSGVIEYFPRDGRPQEVGELIRSRKLAGFRNAVRWPIPSQMKKPAKNSATATFFALPRGFVLPQASLISRGTLPGLIKTAGAGGDLRKGHTANWTTHTDII